MDLYEQVVYLDDSQVIVYNLEAKKYGLSLSPQIDYEGETWYYKHEVEAIEAAMKANRQEVKPRKLKITPVNGDSAKKK